MNVEEYFIKYKDLTLDVIEKVKAEKYEELDEIFLRRQLVLDDISRSNYLKEELKDLYLKYDIDKLEKKLIVEINTRKEEILEKIKESQKRKRAMNGYSNLQSRAVFLSKKF